MNSISGIERAFKELASGDVKMRARSVCRHLSFVVHLGAALVVAGVIFAKDEVDTPKVALPPELKVLNRLVGTWTSETTSKPTEWAPKETKSKGIIKREWSLNGRFLLEHGGTDENPTICMWTYDTHKAAYLFWYFDSTGVNQEYRGQWDEATRTITWTGDLGNGIVATGKTAYPDADTQEWSMVAKDAKGKVYLDVAGNNKRKK